MSFLETPRFPDEIAMWAHGGVNYNTNVIQTNSGREIRNQVWQYGKGVWDFPEVLRTVDANTNGYRLRILRDFFRVAKGRTNGFRFKDFTDYTDDGNGVMGINGLGTGLPIYQMYKNYVTGALTDQRIIQKPVSGQIIPKKNGTNITFGPGAGQATIDYELGIMVLVADATSNASAISVGATTSVTLTTNPGTLVAGKLLHLSGFAGADAALVNNLAHTISSVSGTGPFVFVLATNTAGKTITLGSGLGSHFPQTSDTLTWTGQFDVPCRFDTDAMAVVMSQGLYSWSGMSITEIRL